MFKNLKKLVNNNIDKNTSHSTKLNKYSTQFLSKNTRLNELPAKSNVIFHAMTAYQILLCITEKLNHYKDDYGVIIISHYLTMTYPNYNDLVTLGIFDKVLVYNIADYSNANDEEEVYQNISKYFDKLLNQDGLHLDQFNDVHISAAHHGFGLYCIMHNKNFHFYEEAAGMLSRWTMLSNFEKNLYPAKHALTLNNGLFDAKNDLILDVRCVLQAQNLDSSYDNLVNYELIDNLMQLDNDSKNKISVFFNLPIDIPINGSSTLILGQQLYFNNKYLNSDESILTYQHLIEYYSNNNSIIIKPHPADKSDYSKYIDNTYAFTTNFPSELLLFINNITYENAITINSTSIHHFNKYIKNTLFLGYEFLDFIPIIHRVNITLKLLASINTQCLTVYINNIDHQQIENFYKLHSKEGNISFKQFLLEDIPSNQLLLVNINSNNADINLNKVIEKITDSSVLFIFDDNLYTRHLLPTYYEDLYPINLKFTKDYPEALFNKKNEQIYIYTKNTNYLNQLLSTEIELLLNFLKVKLNVKKVTPEQLEISRLDLKVKSLEYKLESLL